MKITAETKKIIREKSAAINVGQFRKPDPRCIEAIGRVKNVAHIFRLWDFDERSYRFEVFPLIKSESIPK